MADGSSSREDFTFTSYRRNRALSQSQRFCILRSFVRLLACSLVATLRYGRYLLPPISHIFSSRHFRHNFYCRPAIDDDDDDDDDDE